MLGKTEYNTIIQKILVETGCPKGIEFYDKTLTGKMAEGIMYRKDFHYGKIISQAIREMYQSQYFEALNMKWNVEFEPVCENKNKIVSRFGWEYFSGVLVIVGVTTIAGCILNIFENIFVYFYKRKAFNINTKNELQEKQQPLHQKSTKELKNKQKLVLANRALSAYLKDTIALEDHGVSLHQHKQFPEFKTSVT